MQQAWNWPHAALVYRLLRINTVLLFCPYSVYSFWICSGKKVCLKKNRQNWQKKKEKKNVYVTKPCTDFHTLTLVLNVWVDGLKYKHRKLPYYFFSFTSSFLLKWYYNFWKKKHETDFVLLSYYTAHPHEVTACIEILSDVLQTIENDIHLKNEEKKPRASSRYKRMGQIFTNNVISNYRSMCIGQSFNIIGCIWGLFIGAGISRRSYTRS